MNNNASFHFSSFLSYLCGEALVALKHQIPIVLYSPCPQKMTFLLFDESTHLKLDQLTNIL
jgi:hypothetical protein